MLRSDYINIFLLLSLVFCSSCHSKSREKLISNSATKISSPDYGKVIKIIDGDTYDILLEGNKTLRIRMEGIDAPEKGMPFYRVAKNYLGELCFGKNVHLKILDKDMHDRTVAYSYLDDRRELSHEMIKAGLAWHFTKYSSDTTLANLEIQARNLKLGLWIDKNPMPPWEDRKLHREGISTKDSLNINNNSR
jgi:endonuclease YncB( thermonuclease family)